MTTDSPHLRPEIAITPAHPTDLEAIVTLLELAAISLTPEPDTLFTFEELMAEVHAIGGDEIVIDERDARIVLNNAHFLGKRAGKMWLK